MNPGHQEQVPQEDSSLQGNAAEDSQKTDSSSETEAPSSEAAETDISGETAAPPAASSGDSSALPPSPSASKDTGGSGADRRQICIFYLRRRTEPQYGKNSPYSRRKRYPGHLFCHRTDGRNFHAALPHDCRSRPHAGDAQLYTQLRRNIRLHGCLPGRIFRKYPICSHRLPDPVRFSTAFREAAAIRCPRGKCR